MPDTAQAIPSMPDESVPFNRPSIEGDEIAHMRHAVEGGHSSAKGPFSARVSELLREQIGADDVLLTTSCTAALEMSAMLLDLQPGDRVIVPSFTFVTTALAFARAGASLVFADIEPRTLGIDPAHVSSLLDDRVRAVVAVHYAGVGCDIAGLQEAIHGQAHLVEDNAHGLFGRYRERPLGSFGRFSTLSFHETKNFVCGEGGALVLNQPDDVDRAHVVYDKGTNRRAFLKGAVDKYSWVDDGSSFGLSDILAAYLLGQLEARDVILAKRRAVYDRYQANLAPYADECGFDTPYVPADRSPAYHMYYLLFANRETRDHVLETLRTNGYQATFHYVPLHDSIGAKRHLAEVTDCPVTADVAGRLLRLPFFNDLEPQHVDRISELVVRAAAGRP